MVINNERWQFLVLEKTWERCYSILPVVILWKYAMCFSMKFTFPFDLQSAWLCLAEIGSSSNKLDHSFVVKSWNEYSQGLKGLSFRPLICSWHWKKTCHFQDWQLKSDPYTIKFCKQWLLMNRVTLVCFKHFTRSQVFNFCDFLQPRKTWNLRPGKLSTNKVFFYWLFYFSDYDCETVCRILAVLGSTASLLPSDAVSTLIGRFIIS